MPSFDASSLDHRLPVPGEDLHRQSLTHQFVHRLPRIGTDAILHDESREQFTIPRQNGHGRGGAVVRTASFERPFRPAEPIPVTAQEGLEPKAGNLLDPVERHDPARASGGCLRDRPRRRMAGADGHPEGDSHRRRRDLAPH